MFLQIIIDYWYIMEIQLNRLNISEGGKNEDGKICVT